MANSHNAESKQMLEEKNNIDTPKFYSWCPPPQPDVKKFYMMGCVSYKGIYYYRKFLTTDPVIIFLINAKDNVGYDITYINEDSTVLNIKFKTSIIKTERMFSSILESDTKYALTCPLCSMVYGKLEGFKKDGSKWDNHYQSDRHVRAEATKKYTPYHIPSKKRRPESNHRENIQKKVKLNDEKIQTEPRQYEKIKTIITTHEKTIITKGGLYGSEEKAYQNKQSD
jgi:hypothetical protein